ncbi:MAG: rhamnulokinase [Prevotellaceae bacterium]|jgi:rhamnulokinase|nr:rhamnulokinase [Prevotellaceae bacterium]
MQQSFFAVDLGATSGRTILGTFTPQGLELEEVNRFPNRMIQVRGHYYWDLYELYRQIIEGLKAVAQRKEVQITSIGIDTWGVDFALFGKDGELLRLPYSYRDPQTVGMPEEFFKSHFARDKVYTWTGIQIMDFNTLYQLAALWRRNDSAFRAVDKILFIPDALNYLLTGKMATEYTIASTSQCLSAYNMEFDYAILYKVHVERETFPPIVLPGTTVGTLTEEVQQRTGLGAVPVIAVAEHDTASAVAAVPAADKNFAYLSSGTWSLMGVEVKKPVVTHEAYLLNYTNERGVEGTVRLLKNICGMWLLERCRADWEETDYDTLIGEARAAEPFRSIINPDDPSFANPTHMPQAIRDYCAAHGQPVPETHGQFTRCIFESLALRYRQVLDNLRTLSEHPIEVLHVIGGGSRNDLLNQWTANAIGIPVIAGPAEATAIGNIMVQAIAAGQAADVASMRQLIRSSVPLKTFQPEDTDLWDNAFQQNKYD